MKYVFIVVGVGGTGSLVARDIPKLIYNNENEMILIDGDAVEKKNMVRQSYQTHDIGENKAIALSRKINTFYGCICEAYDKYITKDEIIAILDKYSNFVPVLIGCVDNDKTRALLEETFDQLNQCIYIDSANSEHEGNVYIAVKEGDKRGGKLRGEAYKLSDDLHPSDKSCEDQVAEGNVQYLVTNLKMATTIIEHISYILHGSIKAGVSVVHRFETVHYGT